MGIKCSLLGHAFEESDVERERTEQGDEVVTVVREVERCARCGTERVVSENTEVTAVVEPDEVSGGGDGDAAEDAGDAGGMASVVDRAGEEGATETPADEEEAFEPPEDPAEEDAEILDDDGDAEREPGQWPDDDEGFDPERLADEPEPEPEPAVERIQEEEPGAETTARTEESGAQPEAGREPLTTLGGVEEESAVYVCPDCGFTTEAATSSLREGDSCPECQVGWLRVERNP